MMNTLVAYFSATGVTAGVAARLANAIGADLYEIVPKVPYKAEDLDWTRQDSRSSVEMNDSASRPEIATAVGNMDRYKTVFIGFPIWWYTAPAIIRTFLEEYDLQGKTVVPFATSGGSGMGRTSERLASSCAGADLKEGKRFAADTGEGELKDWAEQYIC